MSMLDYGAILRVDGAFINKNQCMFMDSSDTGYICEKAVCDDGREIDIDGNYFVYAGDENFLVVFYKGCYKVISNGRVVLSEYNMPFNSEIHFFDNLPDLKVSRLSTRYEFDKNFTLGTWKEYVIENWIDSTGDEKLSELEGGWGLYKSFLRHKKRVAKGGRFFKSRPDRFIAEWEHNGHKYEVIFGYGIDNDEEVWNGIKNEHYGFRKEELQLIDGWFK